MGAKNFSDGVFFQLLIHIRRRIIRNWPPYSCTLWVTTSLYSRTSWRANRIWPRLRNNIPALASESILGVLDASIGAIPYISNPARRNHYHDFLMYTTIGRSNACESLQSETRTSCYMVDLLQQLVRVKQRCDLVGSKTAIVRAVYFIQRRSHLVRYVWISNVFDKYEIIRFHTL